MKDDKLKDAIVRHLKKEGGVVDFVKGFREVQENSVYLARPVKTVGKVTEGVDELCFFDGQKM